MLSCTTARREAVMAISRRKPALRVQLPKCVVAAGTTAFTGQAKSWGFILPSGPTQVLPKWEAVRIPRPVIFKGAGIGNARSVYPSAGMLKKWLA